MQIGMTLADFIKQEQKSDGFDNGFAGVITDVGTACNEISKLIRNGALAGNMGAARGTNVQEEVQKELDIVSNDILIDHCERGGHLIAVASEEMEDSEVFSTDRPRAPYLLVFDPLDGSSNIEVNGPVGTIFSVLRAPDGSTGAAEDFMQPGTNQLCAGYVLYGTSTEMVITFGNGIRKFTLDPVAEVFLTTAESMHVPHETSEFAINASNRRFWEPAIQKYIEECLAGKEGHRGRNFNMRWMGAMVADVHRVLSRSGVFLYPIDEKIREKGGRLRLMYEANPMSMIIEQADGTASTGYERIMEIQPESLHQRVPVIMGSKKEVEIIISYHSEA